MGIDKFLLNPTPQKATSFMGLLGQHIQACLYPVQFKLSLFFLFLLLFLLSFRVRKEREKEDIKTNNPKGGQNGYQLAEHLHTV